MRRLRLARARGSLSAPNSRVQDLALDYLMLTDDIADGRARADLVRLALAKGESDVERIRAFFPEYFPQDPFAEAMRDDGTVDESLVDESQIDWSAPADARQDEDISKWIAEREATISASDL